MTDNHAEFIREYFTDAEFAHLAIVVADIERSAGTYCALLGVDRPLIKQTLPAEESKTRFMGNPTEARIYQTFFTVGGIRMELMQPDDHPSTWRECLEQNHGDCIHHVGYNVKSIDACEKILGGLGMQTIQTGSYRGGRYAYVDSRKQLGMMLELLETF